jgi:hypothetical protein
VIALNRHGRATETETGQVIALGNNKITLTTADQVSWIVKARGAQIMDDDNHRITYGQLTIGSTVTVTSYVENWKQLMSFWVGKRTEIGQVIALGSNQITLTNTAPDPETWTVDVSDGSAVISDPNNNNPILYLQLTIGSTVKVQSDGANWKQLA